MRRKLMISFAGITLCVTTACSRPGEEYFSPLPDGSQLRYTVEYTTPLGGVQKGRMIARREGNETISGKQYDKLVSVYSGIPGAEPYISYCRKSSEGIYCISNKHKDQPEYLATPLPVTVGTSWTTISPEGKMEYKAESIETVYLFDRKYDKCLKVTSSGKMNGVFTNETDYFSPRSGPVKAVSRAGDITFDIELDKDN